VVAEDAFEVRGERRQCGPRALVRRLRLELDPCEAEPLEAVLEHQQLRLDVDAAAPELGDDPRPADLSAAVLCAKGCEAAAADDTAGRALDRREWNRHARLLGCPRLAPPGVEVRAEVGVAELPDALVSGRLAQRALVFRCERLQDDQPALELHRSSSR